MTINACLFQSWLIPFLRRRWGLCTNISKLLLFFLYIVFLFTFFFHWFSLCRFGWYTLKTNIFKFIFLLFDEQSRSISPAPKSTLFKSSAMKVDMWLFPWSKIVFTRPNCNKEIKFVCTNLTSRVEYILLLHVSRIEIATSHTSRIFCRSSWWIYASAIKICSFKYTYRIPVNTNMHIHNDMTR